MNLRYILAIIMEIWLFYNNNKYDISTKST